MFRTTLKNLAARKLRLLTTSFAVLLGVAFMAGTLVLTDTIGKTFDDLFADANSGTDGYVRGELAFDSQMLGDQRPRLDAALVDTHQRTSTASGTAEGDIRGLRPARRQARQADRQPRTWVPRCSVASWLDRRRPQPVRASTQDGRRQADDEVVIDVGSAEKGDFGVGDSDTVLTQAGPQVDDDRRHRHIRRARDSPGGASFTMFTPARGPALPDRARQGRRDPGRRRRRRQRRRARRAHRHGACPPAREVLTGAADHRRDSRTRSRRT